MVLWVVPAGLVFIYPVKHREGSGSWTRGQSWLALGTLLVCPFFWAGTRVFILVQSSSKPPDKKRNIKAKKSVEIIVKQLGLPNIHRVSVRALTEQQYLGCFVLKFYGFYFMLKPRFRFQLENVLWWILLEQTFRAELFMGPFKIFKPGSFPPSSVYSCELHD